MATTKDRLVVALYDNVKGQVLSFRARAEGLDLDAAGPAEGLHHRHRLGLRTPTTRLIVNVASFLTPNSQWLADAAGRQGRSSCARLPARFDASKHVVEQFWATSKDGTKVPYFVVRPKDLKFDGTSADRCSTPTAASRSARRRPTAATVGKLWLEKGGVYVVANIRGGGEFGPRWHNAGLKLNRMRVYDDFFAVSEDLIARKITSPTKLGIMGGSNGGLLMGVALTQRPELYNAIVIQVPLFDMIGYTTSAPARPGSASTATRRSRPSGRC